MVKTSSRRGSDGNKPPIQVAFFSIVVQEKQTALQKEKFFIDEEATATFEYPKTLYIGASGNYRVTKKDKPEVYLKEESSNNNNASDEDASIIIETPSYVIQLNEPQILNDAERKKWKQFRQRVLAMDVSNKKQKEQIDDDGGDVFANRRVPMMVGGIGRGRTGISGHNKAPLARRGRAFGSKKALASSTPLSILPSLDDDKYMYNNNDDGVVAMEEDDDDEQEFSSSPSSKKRESPKFSDEEEEDDDVNDERPLQSKRSKKGRSKKRQRKKSVWEDDDDDDFDEDHQHDADDERTTTHTPSPDAVSPTTEKERTTTTAKEGNIYDYFRTKNGPPTSFNAAKSTGAAAKANATSLPAPAPSSGSRYEPSSAVSSPHEAAATSTPPRSSSRDGRRGDAPTTARKSLRSKKKRSNISSTSFLSQDYDIDDNDDDNYSFTKPPGSGDVTADEEDVLTEFPDSPRRHQAKNMKSTDPLAVLDTVPQSARFKTKNKNSFHPERYHMKDIKRQHHNGKQHYNNMAGRVVARRHQGQQNIAKRFLDNRKDTPSSASSLWDPSKTPDLRQAFSRRHHPRNHSSSLINLSDNAASAMTTPARADLFSNQQDVTEHNPCRGLKNLGNTCYMNASLQMLYTLQGFCGSLSSLWNRAAAVQKQKAAAAATAAPNDSSTIKSIHDILPLTKSVVHTYKALQDPNKTKPVIPRAVKSAMDALTDKFVGYEQRDAHEFLSDLIDFLREESVKAQKTVFNITPSPSEDEGNANNNNKTEEGKVDEEGDDNDKQSGDTPAGDANVDKENDQEQANDEPPQGVANDDTTTKSPAVGGKDEKKNDESAAMVVTMDNKEAEADETPAAKGNGESSSSTTTRRADEGDDFCLTAEVTLTCDRCKYSRTKEEIYRHLSLDIIAPETATASAAANEKDKNKTPPCSLQTSLEHFFQPETREIKCEKCLVGTHVSQSLRIIERPKALLLHLKRFIVVEKPQPIEEDTSNDNKMGGNENVHPNSPSSRRPPPPRVVMDYEFHKNKAPVEIAERLSLENFLCQPIADDEKSPLGEYKIQSIVHHIGSRASSGHYTADALRPSNELQSPDTDKKDAYKKDNSNDDSKVPSEGDKEPSTTKTNDDETHDKSDKTAEATTSSPSSSGQPAVVVAEEQQEDEEKEEWVSFDDTMSCRKAFSDIAGKTFKQKTAYMLLYKFEPGTATAVVSKESAAVAK